MECQDVGSSNADIAGLGIVLSFTIQGALSFVLSIWHTYLSVKSSPENSQQDSETLSPDEIDQRREREEKGKLKMTLIKNILKNVSDAQLLNGISLLIGALFQQNTLSLYHYHIVYDSVNFTGISAAAAAVVVFGTPNTTAHTLFLLTVFRSLYLPYIILFGSRLGGWDGNISGLCYHAGGITIPESTFSMVHPVHDRLYLGVTALYFLGVFNYCTMPAHITLLKHLEKSQIRQRLGLMRSHALYILMFPFDSPLLTYRELWVHKNLFLLFFRLSPRQMYEQLAQYAKGCTDRIRVFVGTLPPWPEQIRNDFSRMRAKLRRWLTSESHGQWSGVFGLIVLNVAIGQYPVHAYMLFQLRQANEQFLSGDPESFWGFGQVVALVLVAATVMDCVRSLSTYVILMASRKDSNKSDEWRQTMSLLSRLLVDDSIRWPPTSQVDSSTQCTRLAASQGGEDTIIRVERRCSV